MRDILVNLPHSPRPFARVYAATTVQGPAPTSQRRGGWRGSRVVGKQMCSWTLPLPLGSRLPPSKELPPAFQRVRKGRAAVEVYRDYTNLATQPLADHGLLWSDWPTPRASDARPLTFTAFADLFPAKTLHFYFFAQEHAEVVMGQQKDFMDFLEAVRFVPCVWEPLCQRLPQQARDCQRDYIEFTYMESAQCAPLRVFTTAEQNAAAAARALPPPQTLRDIVERMLTGDRRREAAWQEDDEEMANLRKRIRIMHKVLPAFTGEPREDQRLFDGLVV